MNYELIKAAVAAVIKENGNEEITGNLLQQVLHSIINILGVGYQYMGMATPSTTPGTPDARQFYFAAQEGTYSNFTTSPITELDGRELAIFYYDTAWHVVMTGVATRDAMGGYAFYGESLASGSVITGVDENTFFLVGPGTYTINGYSTTISTPGISALMYDASNDELIDYTLFPYDTTPTAGSTNPVTSGGVKTALDGKIDKVPDALTGEIPVFDGDGGLEGSDKLLSDIATKEDIAVLAGEAGLAEAVIDTDGAGTEQEFTFRKSGGDGGAYYRKIKGKTLVWNQLAEPNVATSRTVSGVTVTRSGSGYILSGQSSGWSTNGCFAKIAKNNHKYFIHLSDWTGAGADGWALRNAANSSNLYADAYGITLAQNADNEFGFAAVSGYEFSENEPVRYLTIIDLTQMFGPGNEPATLADFVALYAIKDYAPKPGTLKSNDADAVETTGANQWDEEWESGYYSSTTGEKMPNTETIRSKNKIPVFPSTQYYFNTGNNGAIDIFCFGADGEFISTQGVLNQIFTTPPQCYYIAFNTRRISEITTYNHDICVNLSNAAINGQYFPYWKRTLQLGITTREDTDGNVPFADGMKGDGWTHADECDKNGGRILIRKVVLNGTESWSYAAGSFMYSLPVSPLLTNTQGRGYGLSNKFGISAPSASYPDIGTWDVTDARVGFHRSLVPALAESTNPQDWKDWLAAQYANGTPLEMVYAIATPVPFTWAEPLNLGVKVDENGTEKAVAPEGATAPSAPFVADTTYTMSVARMVAKLNLI